MNKKYVIKEELVGDAPDDVVVVTKIKEVVVNGQVVPIYKEEETENIKKMDIVGGD